MKPSDRDHLAVPTLRLAVLACVLGLLSGSSLATAADSSNDEIKEIFGDLGTATSVKDSADDAAAAESRAGDGVIAGRVFDADSAKSITGVTVIVLWPEVTGQERRQEVRITDSDGAFEFPAIPAGDYELNFIKSGYRHATMTDFEVIAGQVNQADFPLPPLPLDNADQVLELDAFVVEESTVRELMSAIELRMDSDSLLNIMSEKDFSKFAASDVAEAIKRVAGVNVVEGKFAVIRGLEERYSSTTFNGAPVPSSDPLRQSVQLDLFPSDVVTGLTIAKSFEAATPGNSGAGSIDIGTFGYPDEVTFKVTGKAGYNDNAFEEFLGYQDNSPVADPKDNSDVIETDFSVLAGGSRELWDRSLDVKFIFANEIDYDTALGTVSGLEPRLPSCATAGGFTVRCLARNAQTVVESGGLALGRLDLSNGVFDYTRSDRDHERTYFGGLGFDLDREGDHRFDFTAFHTKKSIESVERLDEGVIAGFDYANTPVFDFGSPSLLYNAGATDGSALATEGSPLARFRQVEQLADGPLSIDPMVIGRSVTQDRELSVYQVNLGNDLSALLSGLRFDGVANYARSRQDEAAFQMRYWYEPYSAVNFDEDNLPVPSSFPPKVSDFPVDEFGPGSFRTNNRDIIYNENDIDETQWFGRGDLAYEVHAREWLTLEFLYGFWIERAKRTLEFTDYQGSDPTPGLPGVERFFVEGPAESQLGPNVFRAFDLGGLGKSESEFTRDITATPLSLKGTFWDDLDVVGGVRIEKIKIISDNQPYTGLCRNPRGQPSVPLDETRSGNCPEGYLPAIYPQRYLYLDRFDNPNNPFLAENEQFAVFGNQDEILGIDLPLNEPGVAGCPLPEGCVDLLSKEDVASVLRGEIDETRYLPTVSLAYRAPWLEGITLRGAYSQTTARPSFRELGYYATIEPGQSTRLVGNPFLKLSDVTSYDARIEHVWGEGDLFAVSFFYKTIDNPIEIVQLSDYSVVDFPLFEGPFRVYRNNENDADLIGVEVEAQVSLGLISQLSSQRIGWLSFLDYFSIGGNFAYIDASVDRSEFERSFGAEFYRKAGEVVEKDAEGNSILGPGRLPKERRLFNQPEWTANGNLSFDQPDWGTKLTLSVFAISDVLQAAGTVAVIRSGQPEGLSLDEFTESFYQLDLVARQSFEIPYVPGTVTLGASLKNLTDSPRGIVYDKDVVDGTFRERRFRIGREYKFTLAYEWTF